MGILDGTVPKGIELRKVFSVTNFIKKWSANWKVSASELNKYNIHNQREDQQPTYALDFY